MRIFQTINRWVDYSLNYVIVSSTNLLLFLMAVVIFVETIGRYLFSVSHGQVQEHCVFAFIWIVFLMAGKVTREKGHIVISLLSDRLASTGRLKAKVAIDIYISITAVVFGVMFLHFGIMDTASLIETGFHSTLHYVPPYWVRNLALPVGSAILIYYGFRELIQNIRCFGQLNRGKETEPR